MSLSDRYRPLEPRGERELTWLAAHGAEQIERPDLIVTSPALRALATAQAVAAAFGRGADALRSDERLYGGGGRGLLSVLAGLDDALDCVVLVGHNPEVSAVGRHLAPAIGHIPSAAFAVLGFDVARWSDLAPQRLVAARLCAPVLAPHQVHPGRADAMTGLVVAGGGETPRPARTSPASRG